MFEFLKGKKNRFIGVDFGTSSIKVVELSYHEQKAFLENYGLVDMRWAEKGMEAVNVRAQSYEQKINSALKQLLERMNLKHGNANVSIPGFSGLITILDLPEMNDEELAKAIQFEAHKYVPTSLDEVALSWEVIEKSAKAIAAKGAGRIKVLLVAAPKKEIEHYDRLVANTQLTVSAIELETFSISRALVGDDSGTFLIIDIGNRATNIVLVEKGIVRVNRNIDAGGSEITGAISDSMNISKQRAEMFKRGEKDLLNSKETAIIIPVLELITGEAQRIIAAHQARSTDARIDSVILSGGTAKMVGIEQYFSRMLNTKVTIGNPWRRITVDDKVAPFTKELGTSFAVALGLALRGVEEYKRK